MRKKSKHIGGLFMLRSVGDESVDILFIMGDNGKSLSDELVCDSDHGEFSRLPVLPEPRVCFPTFSMVGVTKTWFFGIPEDFILVLTAIPALYIFFREYFALDLHQDSKPQAKYINALLILVCIGVCIALCCALFAQISRDM